MRTRRHRLACLAAASVIAVAAPACSDEGGGTSAGSSASTTVTVHGTGSPDPTSNPALSTEPRIDRFDVEPGACAEGEAPTSVSWVVPDATVVSLVLDQEQVALAGHDPTTDNEIIALACDGRAHTVVLVAMDAVGHQSVQSRSVIPG